MVQIADIPYITEYKNASDMQLVVDALSTAYMYKDIDCFAIISSDRDFAPLISKLHELGRIVIGIGVSTKQTSPVYVQACDKFIYYDNLIEVPAVDFSDLSPDDLHEKFEEYSEILVRAISTLEERGMKATGKELIQIIYRLKSDFNANLAGCNSFRDFIKRAEEERVVKVLWSTGEGDFVVLLRPETQAPSPKTVLPIQYEMDDPQKASNYYRALIQRKLKVPFPKHQYREMIFKAIDDMYETMKASGSVQMRKLSEEAHRKYIDGNMRIDQRMVYKMLYSLYLAGCFHKCPESEDMDQDQYNPYVALDCPPRVWEYKVNLVFLRGIVMEDGQVELKPEGLSWLFYEDLDHVEECQKMINEITWQPESVDASRSSHSIIDPQSISTN
jgi:hypothetical protein